MKRKRPSRTAARTVAAAAAGSVPTSGSDARSPARPRADPATSDDPPACACGTEGRKASGSDERTREANIQRLRRIEGQVRGIQGMIAGDRYCADVLVQLSSVQEALRAVGREVMRNHLRHCATVAIRAGGSEADEMYDELLRLIYRHGP